MKKLLIIASLIFLAGCAGKQEKREMVYICTGSHSKCYHCDEECWGLGACRASIEKVDIDDAEAMGRRPCSICYDL